MGNKDYTDWNGRKRRLERMYAEMQAKQKEIKPKKAKKNKAGGITQRLNRAESLICDMARCLCYFVEEYKDTRDINSYDFWTKWRMDDAERLVKKADKCIKEEGC